MNPQLWDVPDSGTEDSMALCCWKCQPSTYAFLYLGPTGISVFIHSCRNANSSWKGRTREINLLLMNVMSWKGTVSVHSDFYHKLTQTLKQYKCIFSWFLGAGKSEIKMPIWLASGESPCPGCRLPTSCILSWQREHTGSLSLL